MNQKIKIIENRENNDAIGKKTELESHNKIN